MLKRSLIVSLIVLSFAVVAMPLTASAQTGSNPSACGKSIGGFLQFPTWYKYILEEPVIIDPDGSGPQQRQCNVQFNFPDDIGKVLLAGFEIILRVGSLVAVGFVIYGGFQYIISQGSPDSIKNARTTIINALVGMVITIFASAIVSLIGNSIT
jgi:hypothetical protein